MIPAGGTIGILGGGQLGRMLALAAAPLGYRCHLFAPEGDAPACAVAAAATRAAFEDEAALAAFAGAVDVVTAEWENVPAAALELLAARVPVRPGPRSFAVAQDRVAEKAFMEGLGAGVPRWAAVDDAADLLRALEAVGLPAILKTRRMGYDGKGQARIAAAGDAAAAFAALGGVPAILEALVPFEAEFSVLLARGVTGWEAHWPAVLNRHEGGILAESRAPAEGLAEAVVAEAVAASRALADALGHVGVLAVEWFAAGGRALFNEMAPRVHNSGHWTIEGAWTSQFQQHVRAICGLPPGPVGMTVERARMVNLLGADAEGALGLLGDRRARVHLYGKEAPAPGRKMGHVTYLD